MKAAQIGLTLDEYNLLYPPPPPPRGPRNGTTPNSAGPSSGGTGAYGYVNDDDDSEEEEDDGPKMATNNQLRFLSDMGIHPREYCEWDPVRRKWDFDTPTIDRQEASAMIDQAKPAFEEVGAILTSCPFPDS